MVSEDSAAEEDVGWVVAGDSDLGADPDGASDFGRERYFEASIVELFFDSLEAVDTVGSSDDPVLTISSFVTVTSETNPVEPGETRSGNP